MPSGATSWWATVVPKTVHSSSSSLPERLRQVRHRLEPLGPPLEDPAEDLPRVVRPVAPLDHPGLELRRESLQQEVVSSSFIIDG